MNQPLTTPKKINVRINTICLHGKVRAFATITLEDCFVVRNVKVIEADNGLFAAMPSYRMTNGEYRDFCFPIIKELRDQINSAVIEAYRQVLVQAGEWPLQTEKPELKEGGITHE